MPRRSINLEPLKAEIIRLYMEQISPKTIAEILLDTYDIKVTSRTIKARLQHWSVHKQNRTASSDQVLHARIQVLFYQVGLEEQDLLYVLQQEGFDIKARTLQYIRLKLGLYRRTRDSATAQAQIEAVLSKLQDELAAGQIEGYGSRLLHQHFRSKGYCISRDRLFSLYRELAPTAVRRRLNDLQRHRGAYVVPGPNYIWSMDGYLKLVSYGIEVYAAIDAYSRYIIWIYVGISSRTAVSVLRQFLDVLETTKQQPRFVRSDRGVETILMAEAQHKLQQSRNPEIQISECYLYGTSTANQRIESWWLQLSRGLLFRWRDFFASLQEKGAYSRDSLADQITLYAIYMPVLRVEITSFVRTWNSHYIRKQKNRPFLVHGKPYMNYNYPGEGIYNYGLEYDESLFHSIKNDVQEWDPNEYLPPPTYEWTRNQLKQLGFDPENPPADAGGDVLTPFRTLYFDLRARVITHIQEGSEPQLALSTQPVGGFDWQPVSQQEIPEIEIANETVEEEGSLN